MKDIKTLTDEQLIEEIKSIIIMKKPKSDIVLGFQIRCLDEIVKRWNKDKEEINSYRLNHR